MTARSWSRARKQHAERSAVELLEHADSYRLQGEYRQSEKLCQAALHQAEQSHGRYDPLVALILNSLGMLYKYMGRYAEAARAYRRALRIIERGATPGNDTPGSCDPMALATLYHNLGGLEHARGRYARGEPFARSSVELRCTALGGDHPAVAADRVALAALLDGQSKLNEAKQLYVQALAVFERVYGPEHLELAYSLNNLAALAQARHDVGEAQRLYRRALTIKRKHLGPRHPDVAITLHNLAVLCQDQGRLAEAERLFASALAIFQRTLSAKHARCVLARANFKRIVEKRRMRKRTVVKGQDSYRT